VAFTPDAIPSVVPNGAFTVGDFNGDDRADIVTAVSDNVVALLGNGNGTFQKPTLVLSNDFGASRILAADLNGDGKLDLVVLNSFNFTHSVTLLGNGGGTFQTPQPFPRPARDLLS